MTLFARLRRFIVPHHTNNHRAKALHIESLLTYVLVFALLNFGLKAGSAAVPDVLGYATDIHMEQLLSDTNAQRAAVGLPALTLNNELSAAAAAKAADMFSKNYWAHNSPIGATPWDFIIGAGYHYTVAGENLAKNFSDSQGVVNAWMASPTHRANIVKPTYKEIGFAIVNGKLNGEETTLVVQMFGAQSVSPVALATPTEAPKPVEVPAVAAQEVKAAEPATAPDLGGLKAPAQGAVVSGFSGVTRNPVFNIPTLTRDLVFAFIGIMMGLLLVDGFIAHRKNIVRVAGHNVAHLMFLLAMYIIIYSIGRGRLL